MNCYQYRIQYDYLLICQWNLDILSINNNTCYIQLIILKIIVHVRLQGSELRVQEYKDVFLDVHVSHVSEFMTNFGWIFLIESSISIFWIVLSCCEFKRSPKPVTRSLLLCFLTINWCIKKSINKILYKTNLMSKEKKKISMSFSFGSVFIFFFYSYL